MSAGHGHGHGDHGGNKGVALLISVLAVTLAYSETLGKSAQTAGLAYNIEASNLWAFFQAKTIRQTVLRTAAVQIAIVLASASIIAEIIALAWIGAGLGVLGAVFCVIGFFFPTAVRLF